MEKIECKKKELLGRHFQELYRITENLNRERIEVEINNIKVLIPKSYWYYVEWCPEVNEYKVKRRIREEYYENADAVPPKVRLVDNLFELTFHSCGEDCYDILEFKYYFKTKNDILNFLGINYEDYEAERS